MWEWKKRISFRISSVFMYYWYGAGARPSHRLRLRPAPDPTGTGSTTLFVTQFFEHLFLPAVANYCTSVCLSVCRCNCSWWNTLAATKPAEHSPSVGSSTRLGKWGKFLLVQPNTAFRYLIYWYRYFFFMYSRATWIRNFYFISCIQVPVPGHMFLKFKILFLTLLVFTGTGMWFRSINFIC